MCLHTNARAAHTPIHFRLIILSLSLMALSPPRVLCTKKVCTHVCRLWKAPKGGKEREREQRFLRMRRRLLAASAAPTTSFILLSVNNGSTNRASAVQERAKDLSQISAEQASKRKKKSKWDGRRGSLPQNHHTRMQSPRFLSLAAIRRIYTHFMDQCRIYGNDF